MKKTIQTLEYRKAYAVAKSIPRQKDKRKAVLFWCKCAKEMLLAGK